VKFAVVYQPRDVQVGPLTFERAEWFDSEDAARARAEHLLERHETKSVAIVKVIERAHNEVTWTR
jgi:hypothetical protein